MDTPSSDRGRQTGNLRGAARDAAPGIPDTKSAPGATAPADSVESAAFGEYLRHARERRQLTLEQIAHDTKISPRHLAALEQGNVTVLPGGMYRRAMLRAYADSVGLDRHAALEQFERTFEPRTRAGGARAPAAPARAAVDVRESPAAAALPDSPRHPVRVPLIAIVIAATVIVALVTGDAGRIPGTPGAAADRGSDVAGAGQGSPAAGATQTLEVSSPGIMRPAAPAPAGRSTSPEPDPSPTVRRPAAATASAPVPAPVALPETRSSGSLPRPGTPRGDTGADAVTATSGGPDAAAGTRPAPVRALAGELVIVTQPAGARVTIDGTGWGAAPVTVRHLPFGSKRVRVTMDGYASEERVISVSPDRPSASLRLTLAPRE